MMWKESLLTSGGNLSKTRMFYKPLLIKKCSKERKTAHLYGRRFGKTIIAKCLAYYKINIRFKSF